MMVEIDVKLFVGVISFEDIETGFWAVSDGNLKYRIENMPEELKTENLKVALIIKEAKNEMSIFMTGPAVNILDYKIIK